jgi:uncharacterized membrane protein
MPLHPAIVHFPIALTFILPVLLLIFAWAIRAGKMSKELWPVLIGLQLLVTGTGYLALETGETDEEKVSAVVGKKIIHEHEESAEIFVGTTVITLAASIAVWFLQPGLQNKARFIVAALSLLPVFFAWNTGKRGGEIVYKHGGGSAHADFREVFRPEPATLEPAAETDNESLKTDDNDYSGESIIEDDDEKRED